MGRGPTTKADDRLRTVENTCRTSINYADRLKTEKPRNVCIIAFVKLAIGISVERRLIAVARSRRSTMPKDEQQNDVDGGTPDSPEPKTATDESAKSEGDGVAGNKGKDAGSGTTPDTAGSSMNDLARQLRQLDVLTLNQRSAAKDMDEAKRRKFAFWETQPVPKFGALTWCANEGDRCLTDDCR